jgi:glycosyltransferase involved in cell wall biosynthesis
MVSTSIGCEGIEVKPGEHLIVADTPADFANETLALLADKPKRLRLGRAGRSLVESRYSWRTVGGQLLGAYHAAVASAGHGR